MTYAELKTNVINRLPRYQSITVNDVQSRYHTLQADARKVVEDLQNEGLVSREWDMRLGGYPVVKGVQHA